MDDILELMYTQSGGFKIFTDSIKILTEKIKTEYSFEISENELRKMLKSCKSSSKTKEQFRDCVIKKLDAKKLLKDNKPKGDKPKGDKPKGDKPKGDKPKGDKPKGDKPKGVKPK